MLEVFYTKVTFHGNSLGKFQAVSSDIYTFQPCKSRYMSQKNVNG